MSHKADIESQPYADESSVATSSASSTYFPPLILQLHATYRLTSIIPLPYSPSSNSVSNNVDSTCKLCLLNKKYARGALGGGEMQ